MVECNNLKKYFIAIIKAAITPIYIHIYIQVHVYTYVYVYVYKGAIDRFCECVYVNKIPC